MYLAPVVHAHSAAPPLLRVAAGASVLIVTGLVMLAWLAVIAAGTALVLGIRTLGQAIDYAGKVALGR